MIEKLKYFFAKKIINKNADLNALVVYNTDSNFIILIQYGQENYYDAIEFVNGANAAGLRVLISQTAQEEPGIVEDNSISIRPMRIFDQRSYLLVSGTTNNWCGLYDYVNMASPIMEKITQLIYQSCTSTDFDRLIKYGVMDEDRFTFRRIKSQVYDALETAFNPVKHSTIRFDNVSKILSKLPKCFSTRDLLSIIHIYQSDEETYVTAYDLLLDVARGDTTSDAVYKILSTPLYGQIMDHPDTATLMTSLYPIYLREDLTDDDFMIGTASFEDIDELFRRQYDKYSMPTIDNTEYYDKDVDEPVDAT